MTASATPYPSVSCLRVSERAKEQNSRRALHRSEEDGTICPISSGNVGGVLFCPGAISTGSMWVNAARRDGVALNPDQG